MSVKYNVVERPSPSNPQARKKFHPSIKASGRRTQRQIAEMISRISSVSTGDTMAVIEGLLTVIPQELAAGNIVELGDFGSFWLKANTKGAETAEEVRATQIFTLLPHFKAGKQFKKLLATIEFRKA